MSLSLETASGVGRSSPARCWFVTGVSMVLVLVSGAGLAQHSESRPGPPPVHNPAENVITGRIQTQAGYFLTAVNGGGIGGPDSGSGATALHTDATLAGPWELFTLVVLDETHFALKTADGHYVTAVNGGGIGPARGTAREPVITNSTTPAPMFKIHRTPSGQVTIATADGHFLTAVQGGGFGGPAVTPIHTDATALGPWERFTWVPYVQTYWERCPPDAPPGCSGLNVGGIGHGGGGTINSPTCAIKNSMVTWNTEPPVCTDPT